MCDNGWGENPNGRLSAKPIDWLLRVPTRINKESSACLGSLEATCCVWPKWKLNVFGWSADLQLPLRFQFRFGPFPHSTGTELECGERVWEADERDLNRALSVLLVAVVVSHHQQQQQQFSTQHKCWLTFNVVVVLRNTSRAQLLWLSQQGQLWHILQSLSRVEAGESFCELCCCNKPIDWWHEGEPLIIHSFSSLFSSSKLTSWGVCLFLFQLSRLGLVSTTSQPRHPSSSSTLVRLFGLFLG